MGDNVHRQVSGCYGECQSTESLCSGGRRGGHGGSVGTVRGPFVLLMDAASEGTFYLFWEGAFLCLSPRLLTDTPV